MYGPYNIKKFNQMVMIIILSKLTLIYVKPFKNLIKEQRVKTKAKFYLNLL
jgi:hypothetical protein